MINEVEISHEAGDHLICLNIRQVTLKLLFIKGLHLLNALRIRLWEHKLFTSLRHRDLD